MWITKNAITFVDAKAPFWSTKKIIFISEERWSIYFHGHSLLVEKTNQNFKNFIAKKVFTESRTNSFWETFPTQVRKRNKSLKRFPEWGQRIYFSDVAKNLFNLLMNFAFSIQSIHHLFAFFSYDFFPLRRILRYKIVRLGKKRRIVLNDSVSKYHKHLLKVSPRKR